MLAYRLGLRPADLEQLQPVDLWEMWEGFRWRWSRDLEARMIAAVVGRAYSTASPLRTCREFPLYLPPRDDE